MRDGLGPNASDSSGFEALYRFFMTFYFGPLFLIIFCLRLFIGGYHKEKLTQRELFSLATIKTLLAILIFTALGTIILGGGYMIANYSKWCGQDLNSDRKIIINKEHKICQIDSDCAHIMTECSCNCGQAVNKKYKDEYDKLRDLKCGSYQGKLCSMICNGIPKCVDNICQLVDENEDVSMTTDKTEYQMGEEVKLTVENNLNKEIELKVGFQNYKNNKWEDISSNVFCFYSGRECESIKISSKSKKELNWNQKVPWSDENLKGLCRFKIRIWDDDNNTTAMADFPSIYYSNEFTIEDSVAIPPPGNIVCSQDSDCEARFSSCDCQYHCINKLDNIEECDCECVITKSLAVPECVCVDNKCVDIKSLGSVVKIDTETVIQSLIQQMGDENISQETKNAIPEKLYNYGKETIPYLIEALDDERVFDDCYIFPNGESLSDCFKLPVKDECRWIMYEIIIPSPLLGYKYSYYYEVKNWQQWWKENQDKSLNEIRKMVRDYYRDEEEKNNYSATGYRGAEYDYLDFVGDLSHDDWDWDSGQNCHGLNKVEQCGYLDWPISYGCRIADVDNCYECPAEKIEDAAICENIKDENWSRKDNCYWRLVIALNKAGMNDKIDFCDKFTGEYKESREEECLKMVK